MRAFIGAGAEPPVIDGYWHSGKQSIVLQEARRPEAAARLKQVLFAWHKPSWYGADVEETAIDGRNGLLVPPLLALDYLAAPKPVRLLRLEWTEEAKRLQAAASMIRHALLNGWYIPDWGRWSDSARAWKLAFPEQEIRLQQVWQNMLQASRSEAAAINEWLTYAVEAAIHESRPAQDAYRQIEAAQGESVVRHKSADEEDWLVAIGIRKDNLPFRVALQLVEPNEERGWRLRPALQSREGGEWLPLRRDAQEAAGWRYAEAGAIPEEWLPLLPAKMAKEQAKWLAALPEWEDKLDPAHLKLILSDHEAWQFMETFSIKLLEGGSPVLLPGWWEAVRSRKLRLKAKMKSSVGSAAEPMFGLNQIVQFDWKLAVGNVDLTEADFMRLAEENRRLANIGGEWVHLDPQDIEQIKLLMKRVGKKKGLTFRDVLEMHLHGGFSLDEDEPDERIVRAEVELNEHLTAWLSQLQQSSEIPLIDKPEHLHGELRPYQLQGVSWLLFLRRFGLGGVLADDMGLGKTIQFITYLAYVKEQENQRHGPSLLICPTSVIGNWQKELERFAPFLNVHVHYGPKRSKGPDFRQEIGDKDLVITSYSLAQLDEDDLSAVEWNALCLDEAQNIKNVYTKQSAAIRSMPAYHRIALTGTPMENRLTELWSIYDFINPGYLGSMNEFRKAVVNPIEKSRDEEQIKSLQRWVRPFMLRRVKKDPAIQLSLPDKYESKTFISLTAEQGAIYENIVSDLLEKLDTLGAMQRRGLILASLTRLKQLCDHPALLASQEGEKLWEEERSGKMTRLVEMVEEIAAEGERCLIFTQFVEMGSQIQRLLEQKLGSPIPYLHGGVPKQKRDEMIEGFQDSGIVCPAFVLSLKAGGTGLNLTAANHVFHFDRWWNPAVENQATDRAFRIGQTKKVQVHKFITLGTLEEKIDEMIDRKQSLNEQIVSQSEQWITELSTDELKELFSLRKDWLKG
ncbi:DEAD/DEAH box helicase [Paenibacillus protaetiae]|uniref:DEAD/DEAH box helicase n=1 Tax=Paenibacillus protaetiae TaxID=2509456 RepID=A0A4P6EVM1_9BACL|nr:DEAD/DEAH box helicase [Paenibacillus protaetiae]QAY66595.1 DEAD/DEAH box helicase [Paenibacillus protaetiae]